MSTKSLLTGDTSSETSENMDGEETIEETEEMEENENSETDSEEEIDSEEEEDSEIEEDHEKNDLKKKLEEVEREREKWKKRAKLSYKKGTQVKEGLDNVEGAIEKAIGDYEAKKRFAESNPDMKIDEVVKIKKELGISYEEAGALYSYRNQNSSKTRSKEIAARESGSGSYYKPESKDSSTKALLMSENPFK